MAEYCLLYVKGKMIFVTHGHVFNKKNLPPISSNDILLHGHTHIPTWEYNVLNPGSISIPKNGTPNSYMTLTDDGFFWKDVDGRAYHELKF